MFFLLHNFQMRDVNKSKFDVKSKLRCSLKLIYIDAFNRIKAICLKKIDIYYLLFFVQNLAY
jgi:hypothetical protein